ncbi:SBBP repeat-containing protein [Anabaena catenula]|uniref:SBBP repeat-containing protein n=1 Tax=Anabaena catenula FACHB-362 TaxID=2692877 RepID=A0ABR8J169_9NOST|nr:SBBP repeat-containing protein [Anabaena catenula]MBD2692079.1 SBBP repeat-containing protein [Anabaena catenula FACHB-362]
MLINQDLNNQDHMNPLSGLGNHNLGNPIQPDWIGFGSQKLFTLADERLISRRENYTDSIPVLTYTPESVFRTVNIVNQAIDTFPNLTEQWKRQLGTSNNDYTYDVANDQNGNIYLTGSTEGNLGGTNVGGYDAWVAKYNSSGTLQWKKQLGTVNNDEAYNIAIDSNSNVYLTGYTTGNLSGTNVGEYDAWVAKYDTSGTLQWKQQIGTPSYDSSMGIAIDSNSNFYLTGYTYGNLGGTNAGSYDAWVAKYNSSGTLQWKQQLGTSGDDSTYGIAVDVNSNIYLTGYTQGNLGGTNAGDYDAWVAKYNNSGTLQWKQQLGSDSFDAAYDLDLDSSGNIYLTGETYGNLGGTNAGIDDAWIAKYSNSGTLQWKEQLGTPSYDYSNDIAIDNSGYIYITGSTNGNLGDTSFGNYDGWIARYDSSGTLLGKEQIGTADSDGSSAITIDANNNIYLTGVTYGDFGGTNAGVWDAWLLKYQNASILPTITINATDANAAETNTGITANPGKFTITRTGSTASALTVNYTVAGTATKGTDYNNLTGSVVFAAGASTAFININPINDALVETNETVILNLSANNAYTLGTNKAATVIIADNDNLTKPTITINATDANAAETNTGITANPGKFTITRTGSTTSALTVNYTVAGTATKGTDYNNLTGNVVFAAGASTAVININPINDSFVETNETVILTLAANNAYTLGTNKAATVIIADNDNPTKPTITINATDANAAETNTGITANPGKFTITRTGSTTSALTVNYTVAGTATKGTDYNNLTGNVVFAAGASTAVININPINDSLVETNETVILTLAANNAYTLGTNKAATVIIADNDNPTKPTITINATDANAAETNTGITANPGKFTITRTGSTTSALTVNYTVAGTATKGTDYNNLTGSVVFAAGASTAAININPINDSFVETNETVILTLATNNAYTLGTSKAATVTIADNDTVSDYTFIYGDNNNNFLNLSIAPYDKYHIYGFGGDDKIWGSYQNDIIEGGDGNDILGGYRGNDIIEGGSGNDTIVGYRYSDLDGSGDGEIDTLTGGTGADLYILTYRAIGGLYVPYRTGVNDDNKDYALITDFTIAEGDLIQLRQPSNGIVSSYAYEITASPAGLPTGTAIYAGRSGDLGLIAIVQGDALPYGLYTANNSNNSPAPAGITYTQTPYSDF